MLKLNNIVVGYNGHPVAPKINALIEKGNYVCVLGENGSGKTTLMKTVLGLIPPVSGKIEYKKGLKIGYLPQQSDKQKQFPATVQETVYSGCVKNGGGLFIGKAQKKKADNNMRLLGIYSMRHKSYRNLSGGQQQRVLLARALCAADEMLLLDEPAAGLDPAIMDEMYSIIESLNKSGMTVIMITHDVKAALKYADKILNISNESAFFTSAEDYKKGCVI